MGLRTQARHISAGKVPSPRIAQRILAVSLYSLSETKLMQNSQGRDFQAPVSLIKLVVIALS
jgi:hypothetical protein